ncbi:hypothetical protein KVT40_007881 [Elsinoe batatas]|uniref:Aldehyde dehydrogenase domain-containing protein n=1 Tax=Elsinoe batatas TaxID=2601811 RepID=A0A8K0KVQ8_9PEZI|nr:hypothetical protein KVT40_007881 [Elsinoe batatas]
MSQQELAALKAAAIDGRAQTIFYKHAQLQKLRETLVEKSKQIQDAIVSDSGFTLAEAKIEYSLALNTLRTRYAEIADHDKVLDQEYTIAKGKDDASRRLGTGIALIKPSSHNLFFSTVAPLVAAIAAGNVVVIQFENSTRSLPALLKSIIPPALDHDSIVFTISTPQLDLPHTIVISANTESRPANHIASPTSTLSIALVDRNADFDAAARALINARFSFRGRSPHAPDLVLVNEFVKKDLLQALVRAGIASADSTPLANGALEKRKRSYASLRSLISDLEKNDGRVIVQDIRSLDDAIDFLTSNGQSYLTAAYFADLGSASFLNSIPAEVLVGPAFPLGWPALPDASDRYTPDMFSTARPAFVLAGKIQGAELTASTGERNKVLKIKKRSKQLAAGFRFFEQAFLTHFGFVILTTLASLGVAGYWLKTGRG